MNRIIRGALLIPAAAGLLLTTCAVANASASAAYRVGSCTASGDFAICDASGNASRPRVIYVHVTSSPGQSVQVSWDMTCSKGFGAGSKSGESTPAPQSGGSSTTPTSTRTRALSRPVPS